MNVKHKYKAPVSKKERPIAAAGAGVEPSIKEVEEPEHSDASTPEEAKAGRAELEAAQEREEAREAFESEVETFIEISKYFSSPLKKTASYICENKLVAYPDAYRVDYKRGGVTTQHIKFTNLTLEPVYVKLYKVTPDLEQLKYINLSLSRCKRIPPGLSFNLGFVYDDLNERESCNARMILVASRKTSTPCYQICEIDLQISAQKIRLVTV